MALKIKMLNRVEFYDNFMKHLSQFWHTKWKKISNKSQKGKLFVTLNIKLSPVCTNHWMNFYWSIRLSNPVSVTGWKTLAVKRNAFCILVRFLHLLPSFHKLVISLLKSQALLFYVIFCTEMLSNQIKSFAQICTCSKCIWVKLYAILKLFIQLKEVFIFEILSR